MNKIITSLVLLCGILVVSIAFGQNHTINQYSEKYSEEVGSYIWATGTAQGHYYYDKDDNKVLHGNLTINVNDKLLSKSTSWIPEWKGEWICKITANAKYIDGKLDGPLTKLINFSGGYKTGSLNLKANYKNGLPDGIWTCSDNLDRDDNEQITLTWKEGKVIAYKCSNGSITINNDTLISGTIKGYSYKNNICVNKFLRKNNEVSEIEPDAKALVEAYIEGKISKDSLLNNGYVLRELRLGWGEEIYSSIFCLKRAWIEYFDKNFKYPQEPNIMILAKATIISFEDLVNYFENNKKLNTPYEWYIKNMEYGNCRVSNSAKIKFIEYYNKREVELHKEANENIAQSVTSTLTKVLNEVITWPTKNERELEKYYSYSGKGDRNKLFNNDITCTYNVLKDWLPLYSYKIDSVYADCNVDTCMAVCTINVKGNETNSYKTYRTNVCFIRYNSHDYLFNKDKSFKLKEKIYNDWDSIIALKDNIRNNKTNINKCENTYKDVWEEYNTHKTINSAVWATIKEEEVKQYLALYNSIIDTQMNYILFISSRKAIDSISPKILSSATDYKDIQKAYSSYYKACDFKISDIKKDCQRMKQILDIQDSCLSFIELRKNIDSNNQKLATFSKTAKNIYGVYSSYFKGVDLTWTADNTCTTKLRNVIDVQNQFLKVMTSPNISELDAQVKKMKDKNWEVVLKQINK